MTKRFARFARKERISLRLLLGAASDIIAGRVDADLGGGVVKQRLRRRGGGKSGGYRAIVLFRAGSDVYFVHGFAKNDVGNIDEAELDVFRELSRRVAAQSAFEIRCLVEIGELVEVTDDGETRAQE